MTGLGILRITWSDRECSAHYVQEPKAFKSTPNYGEVWKFKDFMIYAAYTGYYRFYSNGRVTHDDGAKVLERPEITFSFEATSPPTDEN